MAKYPMPFRCKVYKTAGFPKYPSGKSHCGEDYAAGDKDNEQLWLYYSPISGTVRINECNSSYGNYIVIQQDGNGYCVLMAHMNEKAVPAVGVHVNTGDYIGIGGNKGNIITKQTGKNAGRHLHIEVWDTRGKTWSQAKKNKNRIAASSIIDFTTVPPKNTIVVPNSTGGTTTTNQSTYVDYSNILLTK